MKFRTLISLVLLYGSNAAASNGYFRSADIHENTVVFTAEGDLWVAEIGKNQAKRLTTHTAEELNAAISPDGTQVAFSANYEGNNQVYLIAIKGGLAKQLSFENGDSRVQGWTPDGQVLYSTTAHTGAPRNWTLKTVAPDTLITTNIPLADAREGVIDNAGRFIYFSQFGLANYNDNARIYRGGAEGELWRYELGSNQEAQKLTASHVGNAHDPMVYQDTLYFISDASGSDNIWQMDSKGGNAKQLTHYVDWPVRSAKLHNGKIIYQLGADLKVLTLKNNKSTTLAINLISDFPNLRERWIGNPLQYTTSMNYATGPQKVAITARGRVALANKDNSRLIEVATPVTSRTRNAILSHDGKWLYAINDSSGEQEIWRYAADGSVQSKQLTNDGSIYRWNLSLSPDGKYLAHDDKNGDLWLLTLESGDNRKIISLGDGFSPFNEIVWSPDSQLLAVSGRYLQQQRNRITLYSLPENKQQIITSDKFESGSPAFSPDGDWLYFLSERHFNATPGHPWGDRNMGVLLDRRVKIFAYSLNDKAIFGFQTANELTNAVAEQDKKTTDDKSETTKTVQWQGLTERLWEVPVASGNYWGLTVNKDYLYVKDWNNEPGSNNVIKSIRIEPSPQLKTFTTNIADYQLSPDGEQMFVRKSGNGDRDLFIVKAGATFPADSSDAKVNTADWELLIQPRLEWQQMFHDAWLQHRDSLFDKNMRGVDWSKVKTKYQPLLARITDRWELNDVLGQMIGELNTLHSQIRPGDIPEPSNRPDSANLGAVLQQTADGVVIAHIYLHDPEMPWRASPLDKPGMDAQNGDLITAVNGKSVNSIAELAKALRNQAGKQVLLQLKRTEQHHKIIVVPTSSKNDEQMRYKDWVNGNRIKVETADPELGYLHLSAMGSSNIESFAEEFYANYHKQGLIIDVRRNRGGSIDSMIIEKLLRKAWAFWRIGNANTNTNMQQTFRGHVAVLADEGTYSDGETFAAAIKALNLGPVIGKRTAGAGVWLSDGNALTDLGMARVAELPQFAMDGRWIIEGRGVSPTIEIDNLPNATFNGKDAQLEKAIDYLQQQITKKPMPKLVPAPLPANGTFAQDIIPQP